MESEAHWGLDAKFRDELGGCCIYATLKDYVRIGIFEAGFVEAGGFVNDFSRGSED